MRNTIILAALICVATPALAAEENTIMSVTPDYISERPERYDGHVEFAGEMEVTGDQVVTGTLDVSNGTLILPNTTEFLQANPPDGSVTEAKLHADLAADLARVSDLASNANGKGASTIGIEDAGTLYTATDVEGALAEVRGVADGAVQSTDLVSTANSKGASLVGVEDVDGLYDADNVEDALAEVKVIADGAAQAADLASTESGKGASLIGVEDAEEKLGGSNVEAVLVALEARIAALELHHA